MFTEKASKVLCKPPRPKNSHNNQRKKKTDVDPLFYINIFWTVQILIHMELLYFS
jgi:hypothetical protein